MAPSHLSTSSFRDERVSIQSVSEESENDRRIEFNTLANLFRFLLVIYSDGSPFDVLVLESMPAVGNMLTFNFRRHTQGLV